MAAYQITQSVSDPGTAPARTDPDNFDARADAFLAVLSIWGTVTTGDLIVWSTQVNALSTAVNGYSTAAETAETNAETAQTAAEAAQTAAEASAGATVYVAGTTYDAGDKVLDPSDSYASYTSQSGSNTGNTPNTDDGTYWVVTMPIPGVLDKTTSATLTPTEISGLKTLTNNGAGGEVILTWPALITGKAVKFYVNDAQYLQIKAPTGKTIRIGAVTTAAAGYIRSNTVGDWVEVRAMPDGLVVMGISPGNNWTYDE